MSSTAYTIGFKGPFENGTKGISEKSGKMRLYVSRNMFLSVLKSDTFLSGKSLASLIKGNLSRFYVSIYYKGDDIKILRIKKWERILSSQTSSPGLSWRASDI